MTPRDFLWMALILLGVTSTQSTEHVCRDHLFNCGNGKCVGTAFVCDGENDCLNLADEMNCTVKLKTVCEPNEFECLSHPIKCIKDTWKCDGEPDCDDSSDEVDCENIAPCDGYFCEDNSCIPIETRCDKHWDCANGEDERNCDGMDFQPYFPAVSRFPHDLISSSQPSVGAVTTSQPSTPAITTSQPSTPDITTSQPYMPPITTSEPSLPTDATSGLSMPTVPTVFPYFLYLICICFVINLYNWYGCQ